MVSALGVTPVPIVTAVQYMPETIPGADPSQVAIFKISSSSVKFLV